MDAEVIRRNTKYDELVQQIIEEEDELVTLRAEDIQIICLESDTGKMTNDKKHRLFANIEKVTNKWKWATDAAFTITVYAPNVAYFREEKLKIVLFRELLKICIDDNKEGDKRYSLRDYDLQDFKVIVEKYGVDWENKAENSLFEEM